MNRLLYVCLAMSALGMFGGMILDFLEWKRIACDQEPPGFVSVDTDCRYHNGIYVCIDSDGIVLLIEG